MNSLYNYSPLFLAQDCLEMAETLRRRILLCFFKATLLVLHTPVAAFPCRGGCSAALIPTPSEGGPWLWVWLYSINNAGRGHEPTSWCTTPCKVSPTTVQAQLEHVVMLLPKKGTGNLCSLVRTMQLWCFAKQRCLDSLLEPFLLNSEMQGWTATIASP